MTRTDDARALAAELLPLVVAACHWRDCPSPEAAKELRAAVDAWRAQKEEGPK